VSDCGTTVRCETVGMVKDVGGPFGGGVVVMGTTGVTTLQSRVIGKPELHPSLEVESSSPTDTSIMTCSDGNPLWAIPANGHLDNDM
jgi:hypothetical protein